MQKPPAPPPYGPPPGQGGYGTPSGPSPYGNQYGVGQGPYGAPGGPPPYGPQQAPYPAPPPATKPFPWLIVIAVVGVGFVLLSVFVVAGVYGFRQYVARARATTASKSKAAPTGLDRSYSPRAGLVVAHYPSDFAAKNLDNDTILLDKNLGFGEDEAVLVAAVHDPISDDVNEFARVLLLANQKHIVSLGGRYRELSRAPSPCLAGMSGLEVDSQATLESGRVMKMRTCFFMHSGHGYELKTIVPSDRVRSDGPLLARIVAATELTD